MRNTLIMSSSLLGGTYVSIAFRLRGFRHAHPTPPSVASGLPTRTHPHRLNPHHPPTHGPTPNTATTPPASRLYRPTSKHPTAPPAKHLPPIAPPEAGGAVFGAGLGRRPGAGDQVMKSYMDLGCVLGGFSV